MNNLKEKLKKYNLKINSFKYLKNIIIIDTNKGKYVYKEHNNNQIYNYLLSKGFNNFPLCISDNNSDYDLMEYIENNSLNQIEKINELIYVIALLHKKTSNNQKLDLDNLKKMYEDISKEADYLMSYYQNYNNYIDNITYMSPADYLLVSNIDLFYYLISFVKVESLNWYNTVKTKETIKKSLIHSNLSLDHLITNNQDYLISWNKAHQDYAINDLIKLYQENYNYIELEEMLEKYQKINKLDSNEYLLMLIKLSIPQKIVFSKNTYLDCYKLSNYLIYLRKIALLIQKKEKNKQQN